MDAYIDTDLLQMISKGDPEAFRVLYRKYFNMIRNLVEKNSGSADDASDLFQEALIIIFEKARDEKLLLTCSMKTYLYSVCQNLWLKALKKKGRSTSMANFEEYVIAEHETEERPEINLKLLFAEIGEACRKLLIAFYYKKMSMQEICVAYNYSNSDSVKNQKYKCIQRLKKIVADRK